MIGTAMYLLYYPLSTYPHITPITQVPVFLAPHISPFIYIRTYPLGYSERKQLLTMGLCVLLGHSEGKQSRTVRIYC